MIAPVSKGKGDNCSLFTESVHASDAFYYHRLSTAVKQERLCTVMAGEGRDWDVHADVLGGQNASGKHIPGSKDLYPGCSAAPQPLQRVRMLRNIACGSRRVAFVSHVAVHTRRSVRKPRIVRQHKEGCLPTHTRPSHQTHKPQLDSRSRELLAASALLMLKRRVKGSQPGAKCIDRLHSRLGDPLGAEPHAGVAVAKAVIGYMYNRVRRTRMLSAVAAGASESVAPPILSQRRPASTRHLTKCPSRRHRGRMLRDIVRNIAAGAVRKQLTPGKNKP